MREGELEFESYTHETQKKKKKCNYRYSILEIDPVVLPIQSNLKLTDFIWSVMR